MVLMEDERDQGKRGWGWRLRGGWGQAGNAGGAGAQLAVSLPLPSPLQQTHVMCIY